MHYLNQDLFEKDLESITLWLNVESIKQIDVSMKLVNIETFQSQIDELESTFDECPEDKQRAINIFKNLKTGDAPQPIFVEKDDPKNFVMEGKHRIVAFKWFGLTEVLVAEVSKNNQKLEPKLKSVKKAPQ